MINFKALALTTIIALGGIAGGNAAQACEGGGNWCSGNNVNPAPAPAAAPVYNGSNGIDNRCFSSTLGQYEVTSAWVDTNCF